MTMKTVVGILGAVLGTIALSACATEEPKDVSAEAPEVDVDAADELDEGNSYNGWTQNPYSIWQMFCGNWVIGHQLSRSYGDSTRGGGSCHVVKTGASCSSDSSCLSAAQSTYGSSAYGYCYQGSCYARPGAQSTYCVLNPNRAAGYIWNNSNSLYDTGVSGVAANYYPDANNYVLGCMTKTAGPNTACGGTNTSLYMRHVNAMEVDTYNCITW